MTLLHKHLFYMDHRTYPSVSRTLKSSCSQVSTNNTISILLRIQLNLGPLLHGNPPEIQEKIQSVSNFYLLGLVQEDEGPFWRVRCNRNLKNQASLNLLGLFEILMQNILHWVKNMKCRKLNHLSKYITFMYRKFAELCQISFFLTDTFYFSGKL